MKRGKTKEILEIQDTPDDAVAHLRHCHDSHNFRLALRQLRGEQNLWAHIML